jgi:hypothetical protein
MRAFIALVVVIYLVGVGAALAPTVRDRWNAGPASEFADSVVRAAPDALAWPARAYRAATEPAHG